MSRIRDRNERPPASQSEILYIKLGGKTQSIHSASLKYGTSDRGGGLGIQCKEPF